MTNDVFEIQPFLDQTTTSLMHKFIVANSANILTPSDEREGTIFPKEKAELNKKDLENDESNSKINSNEEDLEKDNSDFETESNEKDLGTAPEVSKTKKKYLPYKFLNCINYSNLLSFRTHKPFVAETTFRSQRKRNPIIFYGSKSEADEAYEDLLEKKREAAKVKRQEKARLKKEEEEKEIAEKRKNEKEKLKREKDDILKRQVEEEKEKEKQRLSSEIQQLKSEIQRQSMLNQQTILQNQNQNCSRDRSRSRSRSRSRDRSRDHSRDRNRSRSRDHSRDRNRSRSRSRSRDRNRSRNRDRSLDVITSHLKQEASISAAVAPVSSSDTNFLSFANAQANMFLSANNSLSLAFLKTYDR